MSTNKNLQIAIRVSEKEKEMFYLLSNLQDKTISQVVIDLVENELKTKVLSASEIRKLPKELRSTYLKKITKEAMPNYDKYKMELIVDEIFDGIE